MTNYRYVNESLLAEKLTSDRLLNRSKRLMVSREKRKKFGAYIVVLIGLFLLGNAVFPIIYYQIFVSPKFNSEPFNPDQETEIGEIGGPVVLGAQIKLTDYTKASNWISGVDEASFETPAGKTYYLSVPRLKINKAEVKVGGDDLKKSLIQYPGTALPGEPGNPVIFGHSTLPQLFNSKNYKSIFSMLPKLQEGDDIWIDLAGVTYKYLVERMVEKGPDDISILAQRYDDSYLTLVTCVPPGTYLKRLVVRARITKI